MGFFDDVIHAGKNLYDSQKRLRDEKNRTDGAGELDENGRKHGLWIRRHPNGKVFSSEEFNHGKRVGKHSYYDSDGSLSSEKEYSDDEIVFRKLFSGDGTVYQDADYKYSKELVLITDYYPDGSISNRITHLKDSLTVAHGELVSYYENGRLRAKGTYKDGEIDGPWVSYNSDGTVKEEYTGTYKNGVKIK